MESEEIQMIGSQEIWKNRLQYVSFGDTDYTLRNVICGVPHGSILGPKLFILYFNDICNVSPVLKFIHFADDTNIFSSGSDIVQLSIFVSNELDKLNEWFAVNPVGEGGGGKLESLRNMANMCHSLKPILCLKLLYWRKTTTYDHRKLSERYIDP